ncbi:unnamed protein product [Auanema sp. JU1783]|nr:unnamed protein product [Auanema sp. JU1783]
MDRPGTSSDFFLSSILDNMEKLTPCIPFEDPGSSVAQESLLLSLPSNILDKIVAKIPLYERIISCGSVCRQLRASVSRTITSVEFYKDGFDSLSEKRLNYFLSIYGKNITYLNFDLFRSTFLQECTQWTWRQSVINTVSFCKNLKELNILVCHRHRLRDNDLIRIFTAAPTLESVSIDAKFLNGHCFMTAPPSLKKLELEMCYRITETSLKYIFNLKKLTVIHFSELLILKDAVIYDMIHKLRHLTHVSIVSNQETLYRDLTPSGLALFGRLPHLTTLGLEGLSAVTDKFLMEITNEKNPICTKLTGLSLAFSYNIGLSGIRCLSKLHSLENLNLEGVSKRDVSLGLEVVAQCGKLVRLLLAEKCNVSPDALKLIVASSPNLRFLDITNNEEIINWHCAKEIVLHWAQTKRPQLTILTDDHITWNMVVKPPVNAYGVVPVNVIHVHRQSVPCEDVLPDSSLSNEDVSQISPGLLYPALRKGIRYRLLYETLGGGEQEEKENGIFCNSPPIADVVEQPAAVNIMNVLQSKKRQKFFDIGNKMSDANLPSGFSFSPVSADGDPSSRDWSVDVLSLLLNTHAYHDGAHVGPMPVKEGIVFKPDGRVEDIYRSIKYMDPLLLGCSRIEINKQKYPASNSKPSPAC